MNKLNLNQNVKNAFRRIVQVVVIAGAVTFVAGVASVGMVYYKSSQDANNAFAVIAGSGVLVVNVAQRQIEAKQRVANDNFNKQFIKLFKGPSIWDIPTNIMRLHGTLGDKFRMDCLSSKLNPLI